MPLLDEWTDEQREQLRRARKACREWVAVRPQFLPFIETSPKLARFDTAMFLLGEAVDPVSAPVEGRSTKV